MIKIGVVGTGYLGRYHALIYSKMAQVQLVGVVDLNADRAQVVAHECGCQAFTTAHELLGKIDAVSIVVPTTAHSEVATIFLEQGIHTLLEKPIALNVDAAKAIIAAADASGAILQIGHLERFNAGVMALAERIKQPRFIEVQRMSGFMGRAADVDVIADLMIHDIDIVLSLVPSNLSSVSAVGTAVLTEHVDIANARLVFANGTVANIVASRVSEAKVRRIRVFQPGAYLSLDMAEQTLDIAYPQIIADFTVGMIPQPPHQQKWPEIKRERLQLEATKPLDAELAAFVESVQFNSSTGNTSMPPIKSPLVDGKVGLRALEVALQIRREIIA